MSNPYPNHRRNPSSLKNFSLKAQRSCIPRASSTPKISSLGKKRVVKEVEAQEEGEDDYTMSFLQYCPVCDKQIVVPNCSILYCSESCRRSDASKAPTPPASYVDMPYLEKSMNRKIVLPMMPSTFEGLESKPAVLHDAKADLDPTEWKPDLDKPFRNPSPAFAYLSQFRRPSSGLAVDRRPGLQGRMPSLTHTTTTSASASNSSGGSHLVTPENCGVMTPRLRIYPASVSDIPRSTAADFQISSVVVAAADLSSTEVTDGQAAKLSYEKKVISGGIAAIDGSLSKLLSCDITNI